MDISLVVLEVKEMKSLETVGHVVCVQEKFQHFVISVQHIYASIRIMQ
jgi:hypothetical protein